MAIIVREPDGASFPMIETGTYQGVCVEVVDMGMREQKAFESDEIKMVPKICIVWELSEKRDDGKNFVFCKEYKSSLHEKAGLRKDLDAWRGVPFTAEELKGFDLERVVGANCMLTVSAYAKQNGHEGRKITGVSKLMKGLEKIEKTAQYERPKFINEILGIAHNDSDPIPSDDDIGF